MKRLCYGALLACGAFTLVQCGTVQSIDRSDTNAWNEGVVWRLKSGSAKDYLPHDFAGPLAVGPGRGEWVSDPQDGYRFYVPAAGTKKFPVGILKSEADKATNPLTSGQQATHNTVHTALFPVFAVTTLFDPDFWHNSGSECYDGSSSSTDTGAGTDSSSSSSCHDHGGHGGGSCDSGGHHGK
jgi:hypothetical protein